MVEPETMPPALESGLPRPAKLLWLAALWPCLALPLLGNDLPVHSWALWVGFLVFIALRMAFHAPPRITVHDGMLLAFLILAFASLAYSVNFRLTEKALYWLTLCVAANLYARYACRAEDLPLAGRLLIWTAAGTVLYEVFTLVTAGNGGYPAIFSTFLHKNNYGAFLVSMLPLLFLPGGETGRSKLWLEAIYGAIILAGLVLTFSKGAWIIGALVLILILIIHLRQRSARALAAIGLSMALGLGCGIALHLGYNRMPEEKPSSPSVAFGPPPLATLAASSVSRLSFWRNAVRIGTGAPVLGTGPGTFASANIPLSRYDSYTRYAHSFPLQLFAEMGLTGLVLFLGIIATALPVWRRRPPGPSRWHGRLPFLVAAGALLAHACMDTTLETPEGAMLFWFLLGLGFDGGAEPDGENDRANALRPKVTAAFVLLAVFLPAGILISRNERVDRLTRLAAEAGDGEMALRLLDRALALRPRDDLLWNQKGVRLADAGRWNEACRAFAAASKADANNPYYRERLAICLLRKGDGQAAAREAARAVEINPLIPELQEKYGLILYAVGRAGAAERAYRQALACAAPYEKWRRAIDLAALLSAVGKSDEAAVLLTSYLDPGVTPATVIDQVRLALAGVEVKRGRADRAYDTLAAIKGLPMEKMQEYRRIAEDLHRLGVDPARLKRLPL